MAGNTLFNFPPRPTNAHALVGRDVAQVCSIPLDTRRSRVQQNHLYHPITPPSTPPSPGSHHAMSVTLPPKEPMQSVISRAVPNVTVRDVQPVPSLRSQRLYEVQTSDGSSLFLALPPPLMVKLLRSEQGSISSEAVVLRWLTELGLDGPLLPGANTEEEQSLAPPLEEMILAKSQPRQHDGMSHLGTFLPKLLAHSTSSNEFGIEYNVLRPTSGVPIAELSPPLTPPERRAVELQTGQFSRRLSKLTSPTGRFGPAFAVLPSWSAPDTVVPASAASRDANARMTESKGTRCWSMAFHSMLEAVLRDGEDMAVMLGYAAIRRHFKRWEYTLNGVVTPRLVTVDAGSELNTLVVRKDSPPQSRGLSRGSSFDNVSLLDDLGDDTQAGTREKDTESEGDDGCRVEMTGMKDWSNFVFGDPLFATVFSNEPSEEFLKGFNNPVDDESQGTSDKSDETRSLPGLIDDEGSAHVRLLLYGCYHTITQIVKEFYRPQRDSGLRELAARKKLTHILGKLEDLGYEASDDAERSTPSPRRRMSGESSPAKKTKSDGE